MITFKLIGMSMVAFTMFGAASSLAQVFPYQGSSGPADTTLPIATQLKRCQDFGRYVNLVASARDAGESEQHLISRLKLKGPGVRPPKNTWGGTSLVQQIYAKNASPADWQTAMLAECEKKIVR